MYQNYIFDLYGTLIDIHTNEEKEELWEKLALYYGFHQAEYTPAELRSEYHRICSIEEGKHSNLFDYEIDIKKVFLQLFHLKGTHVDTDLAVAAGEFFRILSIDYIRLYDGVIELLEELKLKGKEIYVLSNAQRIFTEAELRMLKLENYFNDIFLSSDFACKKPSQRFYNALLSKYQLDKEKSIMIGNDPIADIKGAHKLGIPSLYIHSNLSPEIEDELLSNYLIMDGDVQKIRNLILR